MLTPDVELRGFSTQEWVRLGSVLRGGAPAAEGDGQAGAGVIALCREGRLVKLLHTQRGRLAPGALTPPFLPEPLAYEHGTRWAAVLEVGALEDVMERFAAASRADDDLGRQLRTLAAAFSQVEEEGRIAVWPRPLQRLSFGSLDEPSRPPASDRAERWSDLALDALCPDGSSILLGVFGSPELDEPASVHVAAATGGAPAGATELHTALLAHRRGRGFDRLLGPGLLREEMGLLSGDWRRDQRHLARAAEAVAGPLGLGCYAEVSTLERLVRTPQPGAWAAAVATREVVLSPVTPALALPMGLDLGWAALAGLRALAERLGAAGDAARGRLAGPGGWGTGEGPLAAWLERLRELLGAGVATDGRDAHPLGLLRQLLLGKR